VNRTLIRRLPLPLRAAVEIVLPTGEHRARRPLLLPDEPIPTEPFERSVVDEAKLEQLLDADQIVANESADCPECRRTTFHAMNRDGSRRCWTCSTTTPGADA